MLTIKKAVSENIAADVTFSEPYYVQKIGVAMLHTLNLTEKALLVGPEVDIDLKVLVTKSSPHFFFNPEIVSKSLHENGVDSTIMVNHQNYLGSIKVTKVEDISGDVGNAIAYLHNGKQPQEKATNAN